MKKARKIKYAFVAAAILLVVLIIAMLTSGPSRRFVEAVNQMTDLGSNIRSYYQNRPGYWGLNTGIVTSNKIAPKEMIKGGKLVSQLGEVLVGNGAEGNIIMPGARTFDIVYTNLNRIDCINMVGFKFKDEQYLGLAGIKVLNSEKEIDFAWGSEYNIPVSKFQAKEACSKENIVIWTFE